MLASMVGPPFWARSNRAAASARTDGSAPTVARSVTASLVWMDQRPLDTNRRYLLKHTSQTVPATSSADRLRSHPDSKACIGQNVLTG